MSVLAVIPARAGSKSLPGKNWKEFCGKPLVAWTIEQALLAKLVDRVVVSTDSPEVAEAANGYGVYVKGRPPELATDEAPTEAVLNQVLRNNISADLVVLLQPTSPLRTPKDIDECVERVQEAAEKDWDVSVTSAVWNHWEAEFPCRDRKRRQDIARLMENGAIYATTRKALLENNNRVAKGAWPYPMPRWTRFEIDEADDFAVCEMLFREHGLDK